MNAAAFFRKPVDGSALLDAIEWAVRWNLHEWQRRGERERNQPSQDGHEAQWRPL
jgi:FixJ family two-component response regulator